MTFLELLVFAAFLAFICWLAWQTFQYERKLRQAMIEKETRLTQIYKRLLAKLEKCEG